MQKHWLGFRVLVVLAVAQALLVVVVVGVVVAVAVVVVGRVAPVVPVRVVLEGPRLRYSSSF